MQSLIDFFICCLGDFIVWLSSVSIVSGVSLLGFFGGLFLISILIRNLVLRAR